MTNNPAIDKEVWDALDRRFAEHVGRPMATVEESAELLDCSTSTFRNLIYAGRIPAYRRAPNAPLMIRTRELARHVLECEAKHSLPVNRKLARRAAIEAAADDDGGHAA